MNISNHSFLRKRLFVFFVIFGTVGLNALADDNTCDALLRDGLYKRLDISQSSSFGLNFRTYLLTENFKKNVKDKKFGGTADFIADGVPISIKSDFTDNDYNEFKQKIEASKEVVIVESSALHLLYLEPSDGLAAQYVECIKARNAQVGFHTESPIVAEESVIFHVSFRPLSPTDPLARVTGPVQVVNGTVVDDSSVKAGSYISTSVPIVARRDPKRDVVLVLPTDHGAVIQSVQAESKKEVSMEMPVGTVIASFLSWEQFQTSTKCNAMNPNNMWRSSTSKWCPCDGREVPGSLYSDLASAVNVPDLRAIFLRGLNIFDVNPPASVHELDPQKKDAKGDRHAGDYEGDEVGPHTHPVMQWNGGDGNRSGRQDALYQGLKSSTGLNDGKETRPKNVAVFYYIRIN